MTSITTFLSRTQRDLRAGYESWRVLTVASAGSFLITILYTGLVNR
jgi:hypothetical protein